MIYVLVGMGALFVAMGFIVTERNAKYILAGYNTMSEEEREKVDIRSLISYFKKFHVFLGISFLVIGLSLTYFVNESAGGVFLAIYPIVAYIFFIATNAKYSKSIVDKRIGKIAAFVLVGVLLAVIGLFAYGSNETKLAFDSKGVRFEGMYGEALTDKDIESIELVNSLPKITQRTNGFSLGEIRKGYYRNENGIKIKLILNAINSPYLLFIKSDGHKIYYSAKGRSNKEIFKEIKEVLPNAVSE